MQSLAKRVQVLVDERCAGMAPSRVARNAGVDFTTMQRILNGETPNPQHRTLEKIAAYLGVSVKYLITGEEDAKPEGPSYLDLQAQISSLQAQIDQIVAGDLDAAAQVRRAVDAASRRNA